MLTVILLIKRIVALSTMNKIVDRKLRFESKMPHDLRIIAIKEFHAFSSVNVNIENNVLLILQNVYVWMLIYSMFTV